MQSIYPLLRSQQHRNIGRYPWEAKASSDVGKGKIYNLVWKADTPVVYVEEQLPFCCAKVDGRLVVHWGYVIQYNFVRIRLSGRVKDDSEFPVLLTNSLRGRTAIG